jgi:hypothetical protein
VIRLIEQVPEPESGFNGEFENGLVDDPNLAIFAALVGAVNIGLLLVMLFIYLSSYKKLKSSFTLGLILFVLLLILQNTVFIAFLLLQEGFHGPGMGGPVLSINVIQFGALLVLLKITWE